MGISIALLKDGKQLHLQHGPIDLLIGVEPSTLEQRRRAFRVASQRFESILDELVVELDLLKTHASSINIPNGIIARKMHEAVLPIAKKTFMTPMAAVAGSIADEILSHMVDCVQLERAYVNNGGDIALYLAEGQNFSTAMFSLEGEELGRITLNSFDKITGIATSGQQGRSLSFGIADSITVLAKNAAQADAAATHIANCVDIPNHTKVIRRPANEIQPDSDLRDKKVVTFVGKLSEDEIYKALKNGAATAQALVDTQQIVAAALFLRGKCLHVGAKKNFENIKNINLPNTQKEAVHA